MVTAFQGSTILMGGDFNVTLEAKDRSINVRMRTLAQRGCGHSYQNQRY